MISIFENVVRSAAPTATFLLDIWQVNKYTHNGTSEPMITIGSLAANVEMPNNFILAAINICVDMF